MSNADKLQRPRGELADLDRQLRRAKRQKLAVKRKSKRTFRICEYTDLGQHV